MLLKEFFCSLLGNSSGCTERIVFFHVASRWNHRNGKHRGKRFYNKHCLFIALLAGFISPVRKTNPKSGVSCLMGSFSWGYRIRGCFLEMRKTDMPGWLCQACWHCVVMSPEHCLPWSCFLSNSLFFSGKKINSDVRKTWVMQHVVP